VDKLTYASNLSSIPLASSNPRYALAKLDICNGPDLRALFEKYEPDAV
jgi:dTDP-glucose 4,6-dehydratase